MQTRIDIWLHKPTNTRRYIAGTNGSAFLMCSASRKPIYATEAELNDARIWSKV